MNDIMNTKLELDYDFDKTLYITLIALAVAFGVGVISTDVNDKSYFLYLTLFGVAFVVTMFYMRRLRDSYYRLRKKLN